MKSLDVAVKAGQREIDDFGFYPGSQIMETGWGGAWCVNPAMPYGPNGF
jgi:hypothetical protein